MKNKIRDFLTVLALAVSLFLLYEHYKDRYKEYRAEKRAAKMAQEEANSWKIGGWSDEEHIQKLIQAGIYDLGFLYDPSWREKEEEKEEKKETQSRLYDLECQLYDLQQEKEGQKRF